MGARAGPLVRLNYIIGSKNLFKFMKDVERQNQQMSASFRWLGRDVLRIGTLIGRFGDTVGRAWTAMAKASVDVFGAIEDINWVFEDIAEILGDAVAPVLENLAEILEPLVDIFDELPEPIKFTIGMFLMLTPVIIKTIAAILNLAGTLSLISGTFGVAKARGIKFRDMFKSIIPALQKPIDPIKEQTKALYEAINAERMFAIGYGRDIKLQKGGIGVIENNTFKLQQRMSALRDLRYAERYLADDMGITVGALRAQNSAVTKSHRKKKKAAKSAKKFGKTSKGLLPVFGKVALAIGALALLGPIMEALSPIIEAIGIVMEPIVDVVGEIAYKIADWIEANPDLFLAVLGAIAGILIGLKTGGIITWFTNLMGGVGGVSGVMPSLNTGLSTMASSLALIALAVASLVISFGIAIFLFGKSGLTVNEIVPLLWNLNAVIITLLGSITLFAIILGLTSPVLIGLAPIIAAVALVILALGVAVYLAGAGFKLAGEGMGLMTLGLLQLLGHTGELFQLAGAIALLAVGFVGLAIGIALALLPVLGMALALGGLGLGVIILAGAIALLAGALSLIPEWARGFVGGMGGIITGALANVIGIPSLETGGFVRRTGVAIVDYGETIIPRGGDTGGSAPIYNFYDLSGSTLSSPENVTDLATQISEAQGTRVNRDIR